MLHITLVYLLPIPLALAALGVLAYTGLRYAERVPATPGRHRLANATEPFRPYRWTAIEAPAVTGEPEIEYDPLDHRIPLEEVERRMVQLDIAGHDDHPKIGCDWHEESGYGFVGDCPGCTRPTATADTHEMALVSA